jgi:hypothetical protein
MFWSGKSSFGGVWEIHMISFEDFGVVLWNCYQSIYMDIITYFTILIIQDPK